MKLLSTIALTAGLALLGTVPASAHPVRECGDYGYTAHGHRLVFRTDDSIVGAGDYNITSRAVTCRTARKLVARVRRCGTETCRAGTFTCRRRLFGEESADFRCTSSRSRHYVVRWQFGA